MKNWYHKLNSDEITKSSHQKSPKIAKIAIWRNFEMVNFGKNGAKSSLMMFHTTFVRKKSEMFLQMSISMSTPFLPHCATFQPPQDWFPSQQRHHFPAPLIAKRREERCEMGSDYYRLKMYRVQWS